MQRSVRPLNFGFLCGDPHEIDPHISYAPSLAKLRLHARIIRIHPSPPLVLTKRLKTICAEESLRTEGRALSLLAEVCQGDIRSCLNALQVKAPI